MALFGTLGEKLNHVFSKTAHARYIRLSGEFTEWPSVASISVKTAY